MNSKLSLLYVEDDNETRENYKLIFKKYFNTVFTAKDGAEALMCFEKHNPDIIFLDIYIPYINGLEVAKIIHEKNKNVPIVILSAHSENTLLLKAINLNLSGYLVKPLSEKDLNKMVETVSKGILKNEIITLLYNLSWDKKESQLYHADDFIYLTKKETKLVKILLNHADKYFTPEALLLLVYGKESEKKVTSSRLIKLISRLNIKMRYELNIRDSLIESNKALGYKITSRESLLLNKAS